MLFKHLWSSALALGLRIIPHRSDELVTLAVCVDVQIRSLPVGVSVCNAGTDSIYYACLLCRVYMAHVLC